MNARQILSSLTLGIAFAAAPSLLAAMEPPQPCAVECVASFEKALGQCDATAVDAGACAERLRAALEACVASAA